MLVVHCVIGPLSTTQIIIALPVAVPEMVLAVWLIVTGFSVTHPGPTPGSV